MSAELDHIQPGSIVGPYRIVRGFKGRGGMARVFEVEVREKYRQPALPRRLALKVAKEEYQAALVAESDFLRRFEHPNVVRIFPLAGYHRPVYAAREHFPFGWGWYYTMELLSRESLEHHMSRPTTGALRSPSESERPLSILKTLGIARQLAAALEHIHERYVINLDVKPGNVLFRQRRFGFLRGSVPQAVLCDFGISRDVRYPRAGLLGVATPEYVSPEQAWESQRGLQQADARSDVFSLGIVLYKMLTGALPFENVILAANPMYTAPPPHQLRPSVPPRLEDIVLRALNKDPAYRFQTAAEMRAALEQVPLPLDWGAAARRTFAGITLGACLAAGGWGVRSCTTSFLPPALTPLPTAESATPTPVVTTTMPILTVMLTKPSSAVPPTFTRCAPTSTRAPTLTPTYTPRPRTPTPVPGGQPQ